MSGQDKLNAAISLCEAAGMRIVRQETPDEMLESDWRSILATLRIAADRVASGARLKVKHRAYFSPSADMVALLRSGAVRYIDEILASAIVEREQADAAD